jgi:hypothetical protein
VRPSPIAVWVTGSVGGADAGAARRGVAASPVAAFAGGGDGVRLEGESHVGTA